MKNAGMAVFVLLTAAVLMFAGCAGGEAELGSEENPIVWSFVPSGEMEQVAAGADEIASLLNEETGLFFDTNVATEYAGVIEALAADPPSAHMASLATFSYIKAADMGVAEAALVAVRYGSPTYAGQIIARADSDINSVADLKGKTFGRPDPLSTSGWIVPMLTMKAEGIDYQTDLEEVVDTGSHNNVVTAVYNGEVDAGATFDDARGNVEDDLEDVREVVKVIATSAPIPNDGVQFSPSVPEEIREQIVEALLAIAATDDGQEALSTAYSWNELIRRDDSFYDPFRQTLQRAGMDVDDIQ
ncbi:phosphate/phosphite/phosphonate ABC transporter substrate-binding protein [Salinispira pacifica]|uniref:Phosphonate ABC transporter phosphate-binding periplasmic component n=1 Tax=Salinispira pacifica TaxID=1307761 RepID=V5WH45_9SPIO|nr:phosphate/phosphite/phosphonate ABC transporter substrate-binding protein [Salinispira pacifica]AHC14879.1 Phosphonate ABC transporter phosphate-binding periplasmic component [Salinispira pacifica]